MSAMSIYSIYKFVNKINNKVYVGYTNNIKNRYSQHKSKYNKANNKFYNAIKKYGWENFEFEIIYQSLDSYYCLSVMEPYFISEYNSYKKGYNSSLGGDSLPESKKSNSSKQKMSKSRNGRFSAKDKFGNTYQIRKDDPRFLSGELVGINKNISPSQETLQKLSKVRMGNKNRLGIKHSEEIKKIISERTSQALKGVPKKTVTCPHCNKTGGAGNMKRYHFDFCKSLII
jgi:group I intron endonuclease